MQDTGVRYRNLARRCRLSAASAETARSRNGLLKMAARYDRRAMELEAEVEELPMLART